MFTDTESQLLSPKSTVRSKEAKFTIQKGLREVSANLGAHCTWTSFVCLEDTSVEVKWMSTSPILYKFYYDRAMFIKDLNKRIVWRLSLLVFIFIEFCHFLQFQIFCNCIFVLGAILPATVRYDLFERKGEQARKIKVTHLIRKSIYILDKHKQGSRTSRVRLPVFPSLCLWKPKQVF